MRRAPLAQPVALSLLLALLLLQISYAGSMGASIPENITVTFLNHTTVRVSWSTSSELVQRYDVTYKPSSASYRVVLVVAGNSNAVILGGLQGDTQYQVTVAALADGHKYKSRPIVFRTLEPPRTSPQQDGVLGDTSRPSAFPPDPSPTFPTIRGVEIGIVVVVLLFWIGAIVLFFNRWGKIRMLLPYQPDYKQEQLKVPGSSALAAATAAGTCGQHSAPSACSHMRWSHAHTQSLECEEHLLARCSRPRVNSAIFMSAEPSGFPGFDALEFLRRHGSQSRLCRKARSADNIPLTSMADSHDNLCQSKIHIEDTINEEASKSDDTTSGSVETVKHFGLPILSVSKPSPPEEDYDQIDEYL